MDSIKSTFKWILLAASGVAAAGVLSACVTRVDTKTVMFSSERYMSENFTSAQLAPEVRKFIDAGEQIPAKFKTASIQFTGETNEDGRISELVMKSDMTNLGNGYVQVRNEYMRNDLSYRVNLGLTFAGYYRLKSLSAFVDQPNSNPTYETKVVSRFTKEFTDPKRGMVYAISTKNGLSGPGAATVDDSLSCTGGEAMEASKIEKSLTGLATPMDCTSSGATGAATAKSQYVWLADLGVALLMESSNARSKTVYKVRSIAVNR